MPGRVHSRFAAVVLVLSLALPAAPAQSQAPAVPQPRGFNVFSQKQDVQLGQQYSQEINKEMPVLPDNNPLTRYVQRIGQSLVAQLPQNPYQYGFHVVQQKEINAFALPGGPVYVNVGTLQAADNEAQVAGVIAHEISHVYMRHSTRQASKQVLAQVPLAVLGGLVGGGVMGQLAQLGLGFGLNSVFLKYSRDAESEADSVGAVLMYKAGYNPSAMANFFQKLEKEGGGSGGLQFLSDHPDPGNREDAIRKQIADYPSKNYLGSTAEFARIKTEAEKTKTYTAEELARQSPERPRFAGNHASGGRRHQAQQDVQDLQSQLLPHYLSAKLGIDGRCKLLGHHCSQGRHERDFRGLRGDDQCLPSGTFAVARRFHA